MFMFYVNRFPLELIKTKATQGVVTETVNVAMDTIAVIQSCADHDPDIDAVYRLTRDIPFTFKVKRFMLYRYFFILIG